MPTPRVLNLDKITLKSGKHEEPTKKPTATTLNACLLEAAAYLAGEPWTDHPACVCPVLAAFGRRLNDAIPDDATRTRLLAPLVPLLVGTRSTIQTERARAYVAADFACREVAPLAFEARGRNDLAAQLRALPPIADKKSADAAYAAAADADANDAAYAAYAATAADAAAYAAAAAANADADADAYAAAGYAAAAAGYAAADAAAYAAAAAATAGREKVYTLAAACFRRMIAVTPRKAPK
jgi:hypothetical protein